MEIIIVIVILLAVTYFFKVYGKSKTEIEQKGNSVHKALKNSEELISSNITKVKKYAQQSISKSYLTGCTWILLNNDDSKNILYTFRSNDELLITTDGIVERGKFEFIVDNNSILISRNDITEHYSIVNVQNDFLFLNKMSSSKILAFANQTKFKDELKFIIKKKAQEFFDFENNRSIN